MSSSAVKDGRSTRDMIPEIESLRGIAIALVFLCHANSWVTVNSGQAIVPSPLNAYILAGYTGVTLFFVLSGFLLSRPFWMEVFGGRRVDRRGYYVRRALRILPLYYAAVIVATLLTAKGARDLLRGLPYLLFVNSFPVIGDPIPMTYSGGWWSLATEVQFYLLLPLLPFFAGSRRGRRLGAVLLAAYGLAYWDFATRGGFPLTTEGRMYLGHSLFGRAPLFALGIGAAWIHLRYGPRLREWTSTRLWIRHGGADLLLLGVLLGLGCVLQHFATSSYLAVEVGEPLWHIPEGLCWVLVLLLVLLAPLQIKGLFSSRSLRTVGLVSYSLYLMHGPFLVRVLGPLHKWNLGATDGWHVATIASVTLAAGVCTALCGVTYWVIERPFLQRKARIAWWSPARALPAGLSLPDKTEVAGASLT